MTRDCKNIGRMSTPQKICQSNNGFDNINTYSFDVPDSFPGDYPDGVPDECSFYGNCQWSLECTGCPHFPCSEDNDEDTSKETYFDSTPEGRIIPGFIIPDRWKDGTPIILCHESKDLPGGMEFFCQYCHKIHHHGRGNGHRVAHCDRVQWKRRGKEKEIPTNSPHLETGYYIVLAYPYNKSKEKLYSCKPKITIDSKGVWSKIWVDLGNTNKELTNTGIEALNEYMKRYNNTPTSKCMFRYWGNGTTCYDAKIRKELRFHVAQAFLDIANNPEYTGNRTFVCMFCGKRTPYKNADNGRLRIFELAICDECKGK